MNQQIITTMKQNNVKHWLAAIKLSGWQPVWQEQNLQEEDLVQKMKLFVYTQRIHQQAHAR